MRFRTNPVAPDAQNAHDILQPTCVETQAEVPYVYFILTASTWLPSPRPNRYLAVSCVPGLLESTSRFVMRATSPSLLRRASGRFVISSKDVAHLLCIQENTWVPL